MTLGMTDKSLCKKMKDNAKFLLWANSLIGNLKKKSNCLHAILDWGYFKIIHLIWIKSSCYNWLIHCCWLRDLWPRKLRAQEIEGSWIQSPHLYFQAPGSTLPWSQDSLQVCCVQRETGPCLSLFQEKGAWCLGLLVWNLCLPSAQKDEGMELRDPIRHQPKSHISFSAVDQLKTVFINWSNCSVPAGCQGKKQKSPRKKHSFCAFSLIHAGN